MESSIFFSPVDYDSDEYISLPFENFKNAIQKSSKIYGITILVKSNIKCYTDFYYKPITLHFEDGKCYQKYGTEKIRTFISIEDAYKYYKPMYVERYLKSGCLYDRRGYYDESGNKI